jgi:hypothetical protein
LGLQTASGRLTDKKFEHPVKRKISFPRVVFEEIILCCEEGVD